MSRNFLLILHRAIRIIVITVRSFCIRCFQVDLNDAMRFYLAEALRCIGSFAYGTGLLALLTLGSAIGS